MLQPSLTTRLLPLRPVTTLHLLKSAVVVLRILCAWEPSMVWLQFKVTSLRGWSVKGPRPIRLIEH